MDIPIERGLLASRRCPLPRPRVRLFRGGFPPLRYVPLVCCTLGLLIVGSVVATGVFRQSEQVQRYGPNLTTELLGIIATLTFVNRLLAREERARKLRAAVGPLRKARGAFTDLLQGWTMLLKGGFDPRRTELPRTYEELLTSDYTNDLASLNPLPVTEDGESWVEQGIRRLVSGQRRLREVIAIYNATLDPAYLEALDELADDSFVQFLETLAGEDPCAQRWRVALNHARGSREAHFVRLVHALRVHNQLSDEAARFRSRQLTPNTHSLVIQRRADCDLTVSLDLGPAWWSAAPATGTLRTP